MTRKATPASRSSLVKRVAWAGRVLTLMSGDPAEQARRAKEEDDRHDDEDHRVRGLGIEHLRQAFDYAEREPREDRAENRAHPADHDDGEHDGDDIGAHAWTNLIDRRREHARDRGEGDAEA